MNREESAYVAFGQYWLEARHHENARMWLTIVTAGIFAILLGIIAWTGMVHWYLAAFGLSLSLFGFFVNHSLRVLSVRYSRVASTLMDTELGLGDYRRFVEGGKEKKGHGRSLGDSMEPSQWLCVVLLLWHGRLGSTPHHNKGYRSMGHGYDPHSDTCRYAWFLSSLPVATGEASRDPASGVRQEGREDQKVSTQIG